MRKASLLLLCCTLFLFACNSASNKEEEHAEHSHSETSELALNNGAKWKADSITNHNVVVLKTIADNFKIKPAPSVNDYQLLGSDLKNGLDKMIRECKMTGADHEALHHWLNPLLKENSELKNLTDTALAKSVFNSIDKQLDEYHNYFE